MTEKQLTVRFDGFCAGPEQAATLLGWDAVLPGDSPGWEGQEAPLWHSGQEPALLPLWVPLTAEWVRFPCLSSFHPGVLSSSLDINPRRVGAVSGCRGGGALMKVLTHLCTVVCYRVLL